MKRFSYSEYEARVRQVNYNWIKNHNREFVQYFEGCRVVLDVACGQGLFLELLREAGIEGIGVDLDPEITQSARDRGLNVICSEAVQYLRGCDETFDGIFCAHFIEHLTFEQVIELIEAMHQELECGGVLVLVFPNPNSLNLQLFGFWKDPQHVRMYDGELVQAILKHYGFRIEQYSDEIPRDAHDVPQLERRGKLARIVRHIQTLMMRILGAQREIHNLESRLRIADQYIDKLLRRADEVAIVARKETVCDMASE